MSTQRAAKALYNMLDSVLEALLFRVPVGPALRKTVEYLRRNARRAHPSRDRRSGRLATGLTPVNARDAVESQPSPVPDNVIELQQAAPRQNKLVAKRKNDDVQQLRSLST